MDKLIFESASTLAGHIANRSVTVTEVIEAHLAKMDEVNPALNAVITRCDDQALQQAHEADKALKNNAPPGPLHGIPFTIKDGFDTKGVRTTAGTQGRANFIPKENATVVSRLIDAGAILIGKTNTPELTLDYDTDNPLFGKTHNPYNLSCSPGGSSGGAAAIVAAGGAAFDIGTDTGGSIRLPAHFCGVAGIKPTAGRVPRTGLIMPHGVPIDPLTQVGPITRTVHDLALILPIISGVDWRDSAVIPMPLDDFATVNIKTMRVAFYTDNGDTAVTDEIANVTHKCARTLRELGADVKEICPPGIEKARNLFGRFFTTDSGAWIRRVLAQVGTRETGPSLAWTRERPDAAITPASEWTALLLEWEQFRTSMLGFVEHYDLILAPVYTHPALPHQTLMSEALRPAFSYTQPYNLTGWPAVAVRAGTGHTGLPIGVQIIARPWQEHTALAAAHAIEKATGGWQPPPNL